LREANTNKWWNGVDDKHDPLLFEDIGRSIENAEKAVKRHCKNQCT